MKRSLITFFIPYGRFRDIGNANVHYEEKLRDQILRVIKCN